MKITRGINHNLLTFDVELAHETHQQRGTGEEEEEENGKTFRSDARVELYLETMINCLQDKMIY